MKISLNGPARNFAVTMKRGKPFFATLLTVSLHSPWQFPAGKIKPLGADTRVPPGFELAELNNFLYADYCVGQFIRAARQVGLLR